MKIELKKRVAKEILIFFSCVGVILMFVGFLMGWNYYQFNHRQGLSAKVQRIEFEIDSLISANLHLLEQDTGHLFQPLVERSETLTGLKTEVRKSEDAQISYDHTIPVIIILLIVAYPIRLIALLIRWAVVTLKA